MFTIDTIDSEGNWDQIDRVDWTFWSMQGVIHFGGPYPITKVNGKYLCFIYRLGEEGKEFAGEWRAEVLGKGPCTIAAAPNFHVLEEYCRYRFPDCEIVYSRQKEVT